MGASDESPLPERVNAENASKEDENEPVAQLVEHVTFKPDAGAAGLAEVNGL